MNKKNWEFWTECLEEIKGWDNIPYLVRLMVKYWKKKENTAYEPHIYPINCTAYSGSAFPHLRLLQLSHIKYFPLESSIKNHQRPFAFLLACNIWILIALDYSGVKTDQEAKEGVIRISLIKL